MSMLPNDVPTVHTDRAVRLIRRLHPVYAHRQERQEAAQGLLVPRRAVHRQLGSPVLVAELRVLLHIRSQPTERIRVSGPTTGRQARHTSAGGRQVRHASARKGFRCIRVHAGFGLQVLQAALPAAGLVCRT